MCLQSLFLYVDLDCNRFSANARPPRFRFAIVCVQAVCALGRRRAAPPLVYIYGRTSQSHRVIAGHLKVTVKSCQKSHKKRERYRSPEGVENQWF